MRSASRPRAGPSRRMDLHPAARPPFRRRATAGRSRRLRQSVADARSTSARSDHRALATSVRVETAIGISDCALWTRVHIERLAVRTSDDLYLLLWERLCPRLRNESSDFLRP